MDYRFKSLESHGIPWNPTESHGIPEPRHEHHLVQDFSSRHQIHDDVHGWGLRSRHARPQRRSAASKRIRLKHVIRQTSLTRIPNWASDCHQECVKLHPQFASRNGRDTVGPSCCKMRSCTNVFNVRASSGSSAPTLHRQQSVRPAQSSRQHRSNSPPWTKFHEDPRHLNASGCSHTGPPPYQNKVLHKCWTHAEHCCFFWCTQAEKSVHRTQPT